MENENAVRRQPVHVKLDGFKRGQMHGHRIRAVRVDHQDVVFQAVLACQHDARIAQMRGGITRAGRHETEQRRVAGNVIDHADPAAGTRWSRTAITTATWWTVTCTILTVITVMITGP